MSDQTTRSAAPHAERVRREIEAIRERYRRVMEPLRATLNGAAEESWSESEIPAEASDSWPSAAVVAHGQWWKHYRAREQEIAAITRSATANPAASRPGNDRTASRG